MVEEKRITGIIPAAGGASRISPIPCSKEILPVGVEDHRSGKSPEIKVATAGLLESCAAAGADQVYMIIRKGKWDIPQYLGMGTEPGCPLAYLVTEPTPGTYHTIDLAYPFAKDSMVLLGFPDILFKPKSAFVSLLERQQQTGAEVVLGLFRATNPHGADLVAADEQGRVQDIVIKPDHPELTDAWAIAVWTPAFTRYLHEIAADTGVIKRLKSEKRREIFIGDIFKHALDSGLTIDSITFTDGEYIDIGTLSGLRRALRGEIGM
ncbi:sugar phosphate nucleotidyltransferase [Halalkalibaculum sp. DA3122]|uniref:sugar phosphate nucleotidyltransferase n=1 Tax=unclassified Halalkalibaculum TaxID=2964617 RepID=UPI0037544645